MRVPVFYRSTTSDGSILAAMILAVVAGVTSKRIQAEKERFAKEGKLCGDITVTSLKLRKGSFAIPETWVWEAFGEVMISRDGERIPVSKEAQQQREKSMIITAHPGVINEIHDYLFDKPLLLIGENGANLINHSTPIAFFVRGKYWVANHAHVLDGISERSKIYQAFT